MDVQVKHGSTDITSRTLGYSREHNICTGIGRLQVSIEGTYSTSISPHDTISIYENGDFKVKYYVSDIDRSAPDGTIRLECQDKSKYLVDYFIPDSYTIDYPSYTRYWIEKFFTEAGITYEFTTDSQGNLLSNYTQLGLQPAYDQIMMLCQLSGWYFYFDGNGKAIIGSLTTDLSSGGSVGKGDILSIKRVSDDKMLRNRAVVWGQYDPFAKEYAFADVSVHTPWNYDHNDKRAMVVSNNNIPNKSSAYSIANILIKEFAKITVEKHITLHGARNFNLGETLRVDSHVWKGRGLITTFGTSLDRSGGLVTNIILDERCPRLFGFFSFGDYVYVGTFGDGIWRKHIRFDPTWYNFSTGLTNLNITDLHINNGAFGSVAHDGNMYVTSSESGPWSEVTITGLESSLEDTVASGVEVTYVTFSGIMARATIVDKNSNIVKFGVDTWSGFNMGDYFLSYSGMISGTATFSGVSISGGHRGWIVEVDPFTGELVGGLGSGIYPIHYSGSYDMMVIDLENDGRNDYVSVKNGRATAIENEGMNWEFGIHYTQPFAGTKDSRGYSIQSTSYDYINSNPLVGTTGSTFVDSPNAMIVSDRQVSGQIWQVAIGGDGRARKTTFTREYDEGLEQWKVLAATTTSDVGYPTGTKEVIGIYPDSTVSDLFHVFAREESSMNATYYYRTWDALGNSWDTEVTIGSTTHTMPSVSGSQKMNPIVIGNTIYCARFGIRTPTTAGGKFVDPSYLELWIDKINMDTKSLTSQRLYRVETQQGDSGFYYFFPVGGHTGGDGGAGTLQAATAGIFQKGDDKVQIIAWFEIYEKEDGHSLEYILVGDDSLVQDTNIWDDPTYRFGSLGNLSYTQLSLNYALIGRTASAAGFNSWYFNGTTFLVEVSTGTIPYYFNQSRVYPIFTGNDAYYIAKDPGSEFYLCSPSSLTLGAHIDPPDGYFLRKPFSSATGFEANQIYFLCVDVDTFARSLIPYNFTNFYPQFELKPSTLPSATTRGINMGGFFISDASDYIVATPTAECIYIDMGTPDWPTGGFLVLQREGSDYNLIQQSTKPIRIDISNNSPLVSVQDYENTFHSFYVYGTQVTEIFPASGSQTEVRDYRYTLLETISGVVATSGYPVTSQILYVNGSGIFSADASTYSGGFILMDQVPSGFAERIETTNYVYPGQYLFVTTSGDNPMFYQKDNDWMIFTSYSGLPDSRATIIRVDDRL